MSVRAAAARTLSSALSLRSVAARRVGELLPLGDELRSTRRSDSRKGVDLFSANFLTVVALKRQATQFQGRNKSENEIKN